MTTHAREPADCLTAFFVANRYGEAAQCAITHLAAFFCQSLRCSLASVAEVATETAISSHAEGGVTPSGVALGRIG